MALEVDVKERDRRESALRAYGGTPQPLDPFTWPLPQRTAGAFFGIYGISWAFYNVWGKKPWHFALLPRLAVGLGAAGLGYVFGTIRERHFQMRDAIVEHYVKLHPEDFEHLSNQNGRKFSEVILPWYPIRVQESKRD